MLKMFGNKEKFTSYIFILIIICVNYAKAMIGGEKVLDENKYRFMVSLRDLKHHYCAGSILNEYWIISAAHCIVERFVDYDIEEREREVKKRVTIHSGTLLRLDEGQVHYIENYILRDGHDPPDTHDIILLRTVEPIPYGPRVTYISIASADNLRAGDKVSSAGWGDTSLQGHQPRNLQEVSLTLLSDTDCKYKNSYFSDFNFCTRDRPDYGICDGDSGGPIIGTNGELVGLVSYSIRTYKGYIGSREYHTKVYYYRDWINYWTEQHENEIDPN